MELLGVALEAGHALQVVQQRRGGGKHLGRLLVQLRREHHLLHHLGKILARPLPLRAACRAGASLELVAQRDEELLELAEEHLPTRRELGEDNRPAHELLTPHVLAQQRVGLKPGGCETARERAGDHALDRLHGGLILCRRRVPRELRELGVVQRGEAVERCEDGVGVQLGHLARRELRGRARAQLRPRSSAQPGPRPCGHPTTA